LFEGPTIAEIAKVIELERSIGPSPQSQIRPVSRNQELPLSYAQQRLWFLDKLTPGSSLYNLPAAVRFTGPMNVPALENSISEIIRRHEVLRTRFVEVGERCIQIAAEPEPMTLAIKDLSQLPHEEREAQSSKLAEEEALRPFDLARGPHLRGELLTIGEEDHVVPFTMHHIASDGWSEGLFIAEVTELYKSFSQGGQSSLAELSIQYADFAMWQREWLKGEVLEAQLEYWKRQLGGHLPLLDMLTARPRPLVASYRGGRRGLTLSKETTDMVRVLSRKQGATLFMTLLGAFDVLLYTYTGQRDVIVGTNVANRNRAETERIIGFFVNQLVMRVDLSGDPTFQELLARVREVALGAYAYQDLPFEKLVEILKPDRALNRAPLFQVKMILQNIPALYAANDLSVNQNLKAAAFNAKLSNTSKLDLTLLILDAPRGLVCTLEYSADLFDGATIERFLRRFEMILLAVTIDPSIRLGEMVKLIRDADKHELIIRQNEVKESRRQKLKNIEPKSIIGLKKNRGAGL
jgi:Condensation domain